MSEVKTDDSLNKSSVTESPFAAIIRASASAAAASGVAVAAASAAAVNTKGVTFGPPYIRPVGLEYLLKNCKNNGELKTNDVQEEEKED